MFRLKKNLSQPEECWDADIYKAVIRCSICTGEQVAGFKNRTTGEFHEITLITSGKELDAFMQKYNLSSVDKEY